MHTLLSYISQQRKFFSYKIAIDTYVTLYNHREDNYCAPEHSHI